MANVQLLAKLLNLQGSICFIGEEQLSLERDKLEIDHIIPRAKGGKDEENNYAVTCEYHNRNKSDADLRVARCMARYERIKEQFAQAGPNRPNLGDFLVSVGGAKHEITVHLDRSRGPKVISSSADRQALQHAIGFLGTAG